MNTDTLLELDNVSVTIQKHIALHDTSLTIKRGTITGLIGPDGSGKSSFLHAIAGVRDFSGTITYDKYSYKNPSEAERIKKDFALMPQGLGLILYDNLSVREHLDYFTQINEIEINSNFLSYRDELLDMAGLKNFLDRDAKNLSGGMRQKLSLICALLQKPRVLLLDEPTTGVDPLSRTQLWKILLYMVKEEQITAIISSAYMQEADYMDNLLLFEEGAIIQQGTQEELLRATDSYTYDPTANEIGNAISTENFTYSLTPLSLHHKAPKLESVFFIERLKKGKGIPLIRLEEKRTEERYETILGAKRVTKKFNDFTALEDVDIDLKQGEITGLIGANGAGKTTLMKILLGLLSNDGGELILFDQAIKGAAQRNRLKSKIGYVSQNFALYKNMTIRENLLYFGTLYGIEKALLNKKIAEYASLLNFEHWIDDFAVDVPMGIKQRFSLCAALLHEPMVLILDEPTSGVDVVARELFWQILHQIKVKWNIAILISTHYMNEAELCDKVVVLKEGKKIVDEKISDLYEQYPKKQSFEEIFLELHAS